MTATLVRAIALKDGQTIKIEDARPKSTVTWSCDSPRCASRNGVTTTVSFVQEDAVADPTSVPDEHAGLISAQVDAFDENKLVYLCSGQCAKDYFTYAYVRPKTPKQRLAKAEDDAKQMEHPFPDNPLNPITAQSDATGFVEENCGAAQ
jgi:hypothetical protein